MIYRGEQLIEDKKIYDICIVGSGPASMTLANELALEDISICILESGTESKEDYTTELKKLYQKGIRIKEHSRERVLGGTSTTWSGLSSFLDPIDLEKRSWVKYSGWPISYSVLQKYYRRAINGYGFPRVLLSVDRLNSWEFLVDKFFAAPNIIQNFGKNYADLFLNSQKRDLFFDATVVLLEIADERVKYAIFRTSSGIEKKVYAKKFIIAAGGIENSRILLSSKGMRNDQVGRYFMNHPKGLSGSIFTKSDFKEYFGEQTSEGSGYFGIRLNEQEQEKQRVLNSYIHLIPHYKWSGNEGVEALIWLFLKSKILIQRIKKRNVLYDYSETGDWSSDKYYKRTFFTTMKSLWCIARNARIVLQYLIYRLIPALKPALVKIDIRNFLEMSPNPENRVSLSGEKNNLGIDIPRVVHDNGELEKQSVVALHKTLEKEFKIKRMGRVDGFLNIGSEFSIDADSSHHMGGTRMGEDRETSVVDKNLQVHGVLNLYIAGSSVFPTSGCANPTLTIVALSIRLADFIKKNTTTASKEEVVKIKNGVKQVIIFGAGRRVKEDVLPVFLSLRDSFLVYRIYARSKKVIAFNGDIYKVDKVEEVSNKIIETSEMIYIAVPPDKVNGVLKSLTEYSCKHLTLIIDTPAAFTVDESLFKKVYIAEDTTRLPWIDMVRKFSNKITRIVADKSLYRYHGTALVRVFSQDFIRIGIMFRKYVFMWSGSLVACVKEPRNYNDGHIFIHTDKGVISDVAGKEYKTLSIMEKNGLCTGFSLESMNVYLSDAETILMGPIGPSDTIITKMLAIKRVGLRRMIDDIDTKKVGWSVCSGRHDMYADKMLHRIGFYISLGKNSTQTRRSF